MATIRVPLAGQARRVAMRPIEAEIAHEMAFHQICEVSHVTGDYREQIWRNRSEFGKIAQSYGGGQAKRLDAELLSAMARPLRAGRVLDIATGTGAAAAPVAMAAGE